MSPTMAGILGFVLMLVAMAVGMPIAVAFALLGGLGILYLGGTGALLGALGTVPYTWASFYILLTIPMFMLMGYLAGESGISHGLYNSAYKWLGRLPGGLAEATMAACTAFAACTGSSVASAATMGSVALPEMRRYGYNQRLATAVVAIGGTLGILIPPSGLFIIYGVITQNSIGQLFFAGVFPGLMLGGLYMAYIYYRARTNPDMAPRGPSSTWREKLVSLKDVWGMLLLFLLVMGGIWGGIFTPTEAAAIGAFGAMAITFAKRKLSPKTLDSALSETIRTSAMVLAIIFCAMFFNAFLAMSRLPMDLSAWVSGLPVPRYAIVAAIIILYIPLGMFMEATSMIVLTVPIFYPTIIALGFDGVWWGVVLCVMVELALVTPPVGMNCYVIAGVARDIPLYDVFRGVLPFVFVALFGVVLIVAFPQISLWLPGTMLK